LTKDTGYHDQAILLWKIMFENILVTYE